MIKTILALRKPNGPQVMDNKLISRRMLKKAIQQGRSE